MGVGIIIVGGLLLAVAAFALLIVYKTRQLKRMRAEMLHALGLVIRTDSPVVANGEVNGMHVIYEHHNYRSEGSRQIVPCLRVRVDSGDPTRPRTGLYDKRWNASESSRPELRLAPTGNADLDARYDAYGDDDATLALWAKSMATPIVADSLLNPDRGRIREITIVDGQVTVVADRFCRMERQRRIIETAVEFARGR